MWWSWLVVACAFVFPLIPLIVQWFTRRRDRLVAFPSNPTHGQEHEEGGKLYRWNANLFAPGIGGWELLPNPTQP